MSSENSPQFFFEWLENLMFSTNNFVSRPWVVAVNVYDNISFPTFHILVSNI